MKKVIKQEKVGGSFVELVDEGFTFGQRQFFVYLDGVQFGSSTHMISDAEEVFLNAKANAVKL